MSGEQQTTEPVENIAESIEAGVGRFVEERIKMPVPVDQDLFATGLVSSIFAMELVVHLEQTYSIAILGPDLRLDNFRTVRSMAALVTRLHDTAGVPGA